MVYVHSAQVLLMATLPLGFTHRMILLCSNMHMLILGLGITITDILILILKVEAEGTKKVKVRLQPAVSVYTAGSCQPPPLLSEQFPERVIIRTPRRPREHGRPALPQPLCHRGGDGAAARGARAPAVSPHLRHAHRQVRAQEHLG